MNRRAFFGMSAGAIAAAPALAAPELLPPPHYEKLSAALLDADASFGRMIEGVSVVGRSRPFSSDSGRPRDRYFYHTGNPAIDCLRSVSGVYRDRMERRAAEASR